MKNYNEFDIKNVDLVAIIGSTKYANQMIRLSKVLQMQGHVALMTPSVYEPENNRASEIDLMREGYKRISIADRVIVASDYVGENTTREYQYSLLIKHKLVGFQYNIFTESLTKMVAMVFVDSKGHFSLNRTDDCVCCICKHDYEIDPIIKEYYGFDDVSSRFEDTLTYIALNIFNISSKDVYFVSTEEFTNLIENKVKLSYIIEKFKTETE